MYGTVYGTSQAYVCYPFHSNCTCTCTNAQGWKTLSEEDGRNKRIAFLPSTNYVTSRHVTSRAINETYDFGQFYYSTRHAKKNMIFLTTNSKPLYIYVYESQQQKAHTHTNTNTKYAGRTIPFLFQNYIIHHAFTLILYYFSFIHSIILPSIISTPQTHTKQYLYRNWERRGRAGLNIDSFLIRKLRLQLLLIIKKHIIENYT